MPLRIGVPRESRPGERLVAATPATVRRLRDLGYEVVVEAGAGERANLPTRSYVEAGAHVAERDEVWRADVVTAVNAPVDGELGLLRPGATLVAQLGPTG